MNKEQYYELLLNRVNDVNFRTKFAEFMRDDLLDYARNCEFDGFENEEVCLGIEVEFMVDEGGIPLVSLIMGFIDNPDNNEEN